MTKTLTLPEVTTPDALAKQLGWSERRVRDKARELGACRILGNRMILLPEDVTAILHPTLVDAAVRAARALDIPMVGLDLMVLAADQAQYVFIEANERAGLANHEPQPTAERFVDLLFPHSQPAIS